MAKDKDTQDREETREELLNPAQRDARGDTPAQAAARVEGSEEELGVKAGTPQADAREGIIAAKKAARAEAVAVVTNTGRAAKEYVVYHPNGFPVPVFGEARRDVLLERGYTAEFRGDIRDTRQGEGGAAARLSDDELEAELERRRSGETTGSGRRSRRGG